MESTKVLEVKMEEVDKAIAAYVKGFNEHKPKKLLKPLKDKVTGSVTEYNSELEKATYRAWDKEGNPLNTAIRGRFIPNALKVTLKENDDGVMIATKNFKSDILKANLPMMQKVLGADRFANPKWFPMIEKLTYVIGNRISHDLGKGILFDDISDDGKSFDFEGADPLSDKGCIKALQQVYDAILYIPDGKKNLIQVDANTDEGTKRVFSHQWTFIREAMTREARQIGTIEIVNTGKMSTLIADAMHLALTNGTICCGVME